MALKTMKTLRVTGFLDGSFPRVSLAGCASGLVLSHLVLRVEE